MGVLIILFYNATCSYYLIRGVLFHMSLFIPSFLHSFLPSFIHSFIHSFLHCSLFIVMLLVWHGIAQVCPENTAYLEADSGEDSSDYVATPLFASGSLFTAAMLDTFVCQVCG